MLGQKGKSKNTASPRAGPLYQFVCCDLILAALQGDHCQAKENSLKNLILSDCIISEIHQALQETVQGTARKRPMFEAPLMENCFSFIR